MVALFLLSSRSDLATLPGGISDKTAHFAAYFVLSALALRATSGGRWTGVTVRSAVGAFAVAATYGALDELHQLMTPGRFAAIDDWVADALGALSAIALGLVIAWIVRIARGAGNRGV